MLGLYVHIPFCVSKCFYCDFYSVSGRLDLLENYLDALILEASSFAGMSFDTLYIGGGTPSLLGTSGLEKLINGLSRYFNLARLKETTLEVNPESASKDLLKAASSLGINRISIGVQSLNDCELQKAGRIHNAKHAMIAIENTFDCSFDNISADIIIGLPCQTYESLAETIHELLAVKLTHISAYCLSVEAGTAFEACLPPDLPDYDCQAELYELIRDSLKEQGFLHYEISNFALPGRECMHNLNYWRGGEYLGLGPSAASHIGGKRSKKSNSLEKYIDNPLAIDAEEEILKPEDKAAEEAMLRLRLLEEGLDIQSLLKRYGTGHMNALVNKLETMAGKEILTKKGNRYLLPSCRVLTSNQVFVNVVN